MSNKFGSLYEEKARSMLTPTNSEILASGFGNYDYFILIETKIKYLQSAVRTIILHEKQSFVIFNI